MAGAALLRSIKGIWESFFKALPWILAVVGAACILVGNLIVDETTQKTLQGILNSFGQAILVGGVFGVLLKSFQFIGVFKESLFDIIFADQFLNTRNDLRAVWQRVTTCMCQQKFPELSDQLHKAILQDYMPIDRNFYYSKCHRKCSVDWEDREQRILKLEEELEITIVPTNAEEEIEYRFRFSPTDGVPLNLNHPVVDELVINRDDYTNVGKPEGNSYVFSIPLQGSEKYEVYRRMTRIWPVDLDPYSTYLSPNFMLDSSIKVECIPNDLRVQFVPLGVLGTFQKRSAKKGHPARVGDVDREYKGLLFPRQGYILFFQVVGEDAAAAAGDATAEYPDDRLANPEAEIREHEQTGSEAPEAPPTRVGVSS